MAMDFDHLPEKGEKLVAMSLFQKKDLPAHLGLQTFLAELSKCELVCANCHRARTASRRSAA